MTKYFSAFNSLSLMIGSLDESQFSLEHLEFRHGKARLTGNLDGARVKIMDLHRTVEVEVKLHRGAVGGHLVRHLNHLLHKGLVYAADAQGT